MMKILHLSDIHIGSGFCHGRINPATGLNTRLEDFVKTLSLCIDRAIADHVDLVLFGGDAFPTATPAPYVQEAFANQFRRLVDADIPTVLLVGNHDQHSQGLGGASLNIYRTLGVPGFVVGDTLTTHCISTRSGDVQIITLPWLTRSTLMTRQETQGSSLAAVNQLLTDRLEVVIEGEIRRLDPMIPTVLLAHLMADNATLGAERLLAVGKGFTLPLSLLTRPCFDYVALGHVHKHQNLNKSNDPPVIYPGSIERVDFSEEKEDKGYVMIELERGKVNWEFCPLPVRTFRTIEVDLSKQDDPHKVLLKAIAKHDIQDNVVRLIYKLRSEQLDLIDNSSLHNALSTAHTYTIQAELVSQLAKPRIPELTASSSIDPMDALKTYLNNREDLKDIAPSMLEAAQNLLANDEELLLVLPGGK
ncbi:exonuclease SbcCD subunit D [Dolichospermum sp. ST_con]|nr:exonuclease SbcCD subunit D [Dolichospermum sp. ST_con]MDD1419056.1 exonuclease SbcCD subunit D [Dolichospermum sp. ST_sed1]MDD1425176.1 exonuclease SbcCD subunit D [Dolichospermum sp. ST_sed9]MDD1433417.1 exonuclease SbcCD subunit D [Dolichospermum sp. ST_sed6]MDD1440807.1 exonuclease SbcCD subunit D [Dolichospermum sp. ST_sed3]MDD1445621.1 exonuclease SbcCD subunit D [Dolichospermum sp. ST_sed8]MDD1459925.1 exonuclease SbcCD subunit D [Dolichospermum sp. ST_sed2]MDD1471874.1 exonuclease